MHKKRIKDKDYFYTSIRDKNGSVKTIYLGSNKREAIKKEKEMGLSKSSFNFNLQTIIIIFIALLIGVGGFFAFTGYDVLEVSESLESEEIVEEEQIEVEENEEQVESEEIVEEEQIEVEESEEQVESEEIEEEIIVNETEEVNISESLDLNISEEINVSLNETIEVNETEEVELEINESELNISINESLNVSIELNETIIINQTDINQIEETIQYDVVIHQPVKWKKRVLLDAPSDNVTLSIPKEAMNISVVEIVNNEEIEISEDKIIFEDEENEGLDVITGSSIANVNIFSNILSFFTSLFSNMFETTGYAVVNETSNESSEDLEQEITIIEEVEELEIEYETPGPNATEIITNDYKKQVVVFSDIHYENILAYTNITNAPLNSVNLYWLNNGTREKVNFSAYDSDDDSLVDYIEWIVPHLSNQTYDIEITILNVQSYPTLFGNWSVMFNTTGNADLSISGFNGTTWSNFSDNSSIYDLKFLDLSCGNDSINYTFSNGTLSATNYSCDETAIEVSKVLTPIKHTLEFDFGGQKAYAYNDVFSACADITSSGIHTISQNVSDYNSTEYCFNITASNVVLDCQGYTIDGTDSSQFNLTAINVGDSSNVTVKNCLITDFSYGIYYDNSSEGYIFNNTIGVNVPITDSFKGIGVELSDNTRVEDNTISDIGSGDSQSNAIVFVGSSNCNATGNKISDVDGDGIFFSESAANDVCVDNLIQNNEINNTLSSDNFAAVRFSECYNSTIDSNEMYGTSGCTDCNNYGIKLVDSDTNNLTNNVIFNSTDSNIYLYSSLSNVIKNNILNYTIASEGDGLSLDHSSESNIVFNNTIQNSAQEGIGIFDSSDNNIINLTSISDVSIDGIGIYDSVNNTFYSLTISDNGYSGIYFKNDSANNTFYDSTLSSNDPTANYGDVSFEGGDNDGVENFVNVSFNQSNVQFFGTGAATLNVKWYLDVYVNDSSGNDVANANVSMWDTNSVLEFSELTNASGWISQKTPLEYYQNITSSYYSTNYTINTTKTGLISDSTDLNLTTNTQQVITLSDLCGDTITSSTTLDSNLSCTGNGLIIGSDNVVLDCAGYTLTYGSGGSGLGIQDTTGYDNVTISNCNIVDGSASGFARFAISMTQTNSDILIENNTITTQNFLGYAINAKPSNSTIRNNTITTSSTLGYGMSLTGISNTNISENTLTTSGANAKGIDILATSSDLIISENTLNTTEYAIGATGTSNSTFDSNVVLETSEADGYGIYLTASSNSNNVTNNNITTNGGGTGIYSTSDDEYIFNNDIITLSGTVTGIYITNSDSEILNNSINATGIGISLAGNADNNIIQDNNITYAGTDAIKLSTIIGSHPENNNITNNTLGNIGQYEFFISSGAANGTYLINQPITNYSIDSDSLVYFKDTEEGELKFTEGISGTGSNLSSDVQISNNFIEVDTSSQAGFNSSANLTFYNINLTDLGINKATSYRNGAKCGAICTSFSNSSDTYYFSVNSFTNYSIGENNTAPETQSLTLTSDDAQNRTNGNLTGSFIYYDADGDSQSVNETKWYKDGVLQEQKEKDNFLYSYSGNPTNPSKGVDKYWNTYTYLGTQQTSTFLINYTKPVGIQSANWKIKYTDGTEVFTAYCLNASGWQDLEYPFVPVATTNNETILDSCFDYSDNLQLKVYLSADKTIIVQNMFYDQSILWNYANSTVLDNIFTSKDDVWTFSARVNDGSEWSNWTNSSTLTILNTAPTTPSSVILNDTTLYTGDSVSCTASGSSDADSDAITYYYKFNDTEGTLQDWSTTDDFDCDTVGCDKGDTLYCYAKATTSDANSTINSNSTTILNTAPTTPSSLSLNSVNVSDTLTATASGSTDLDSDGVAYYYQFYNINSSSVVQVWSTDDTYVIQSSDVHDVINVTAGAYDGEEFSSSNFSNSETVGNSAPTTPIQNSPANSSTISSNYTLINCSSSTDADSDAITYHYYGDSINGSTYLGTNNSATAYNWTGLSDNTLHYWKCLAGDGIDNSSTTSVLQFSTGINDAPTTSTPILNSTNNKTSDNLICYFTITDEDVGETLYANYTWYKGGIANLTGQVSANNGTQRNITLASGNTTKDEVWKCGITPYDEEVYGTQINSSTLTILNTAPESQSLTLTSDDLQNRTGGNLTGSFTYYDLDGDSQSANETKWYRNGTRYYNLTEDDTEDSVALENPNNLQHSLKSYNEDWEDYSRLPATSFSGATLNASIFENYTFSEEFDEINWTVKYLIDRDTSPSTALMVGSCYNSSSEWEQIFSKSNLEMPLPETDEYVLPESCFNSGNVSTKVFMKVFSVEPAYPEVRYYEGKLDWIESFEDDINLNATHTTKGENWTFSARVNDGSEWSNWVNSSTLTILNAAPTFDTSLTSQSATVGTEFTYNITCSDIDIDTLTYYDNTTLFDINSSTGSIIDTPASGEEGTTNITITCGDGTTNTTSSFNYTISAAAATPTSGGGGGTTTAPECTINEDCEKDERCVDEVCTVLFDIKILHVDSPIKPGDVLDFTYYLKAMSEINDDVKIKFWVEDIETGEILLSQQKEPICGDNSLDKNEECDYGEANTHEACEPTYNNTCTHCDTNCKLHSVQGDYCGDNTCTEEETKFNCEEDCGKPTLLERLSNLFGGITGFAVITEGEDVIYIGGVGEEITDSAELYLFSDMYGKYEFHIQLEFEDYTVESTRSIEVKYDVQPTLDTIVTISEHRPTEMNLSLFFNVDESVSIQLEEEVRKDNKIVWKQTRELPITKSKELSQNLDLDDGDYSYKLEATYLGQTYELTKQFTVSGILAAPPRGIDFLRLVYMFFLVITSALAIYLIIQALKRLKKPKLLNKITIISALSLAAITASYFIIKYLNTRIGSTPIYLILTVLGILLALYLISKSLNEIKNIPRKSKPHEVRVVHIRKPIIKKRSSKREKLKRQIRSWKTKGYDTTLLERKLETRVQTKEELKKQEFERKIKQWESKGYDTTILRHELNLKPKVIRLTNSDKKLEKHIHKLERKIVEWKLQGYDTSILEERLKRILNRKD